MSAGPVSKASAATMRANQLWLWLALVAYVPLRALRRIGLAQTPFVEATCRTLRLSLLRIGARARWSVRCIKVAMTSARPHQSEFALDHARLAGLGPA
ncbi:transposase [Siccirubricoccus deserti]